VTDGGFTSRENIIALDAKGIYFIGSLTERTASSQFERREAGPAFYPEHFAHDPHTDTYRWPRDEVLTHRDKDKSPTGKTNFI
jgi:hypothetical protein